MGIPLEELLRYLQMPLIGLLVLTLLIMRGYLHPRALDDAPPRIAGITILDLFIGVWILLAASFAFGAVLPMLGIPLPSDKDAPPATARQEAARALVGQAVTQLPIVLFVCWRAARALNGPRELGLIPRRAGRELLAGFVGFLAALPLVMGSSALCLIIAKLLQLEVPTVAHELLKVLLTSPDPVAIGLIAVSAVVVAPVLEEVIFRGLVQTALLDLLGPSRRWLVVLPSALLFSLIHAGGVTWHVLPGLFILGIILGWLYEKHGSLLPGIVLHVLFNLANIGIGMMERN